MKCSGKGSSFSELYCVWQCYNRDQHFREIKTVFQQSTTNHFKHKKFWRFLLHNCTLLNEIKPFNIFEKNPECVWLFLPFDWCAHNFKRPSFIQTRFQPSHSTAKTICVMFSLFPFAEVCWNREKINVNEAKQKRENWVCYLCSAGMREGWRDIEGGKWVIYGWFLLLSQLSNETRKE